MEMPCSGSLRRTECGCATRSLFGNVSGSAGLAIEAAMSFSKWGRWLQNHNDVIFVALACRIDNFCIKHLRDICSIAEVARWAKIIFALTWSSVRRLACTPCE